MPKKVETTKIDKSDWTWQVMRRCQNTHGIVVREDHIGIPVTRERAIEVQTYKNINENRTGVTYIIKNTEPVATKN
jgi:hypothetical protein